MTSLKNEVEPHAVSDNGIGKVFAGLTVLGGLLLAAGSLTPWITTVTPLGNVTSQSGVDGGGDGIFALGIGVLTLLIGGARLVMPVWRPVQWSTVLLGAVCIVGGFAELADVTERVARIGAAHSYSGPGLYITLLGAALTLMGGVITNDR